MFSYEEDKLIEPQGTPTTNMIISWILQTYNCHSMLKSSELGISFI